MTTRSGTYISLLIFIPILLAACNLSTNSSNVPVVSPTVSNTEIPFTGISITRTAIPAPTQLPTLLPTPQQFIPPTQDALQGPPTAIPFSIGGSSVEVGEEGYAPVGQRADDDNVVPVGRRCQAGTVLGGGSDGRLPNTGPFAALYIRQGEDCTLTLEVWGIDQSSQGYRAITIAGAILNGAQPNIPIAVSDDGRIQVSRNASGSVEITVKYNQIETHIIQLDAFPPNSISSYTVK